MLFICLVFVSEIFNASKNTDRALANMSQSLWFDLVGGNQTPQVVFKLHGSLVKKLPYTSIDIFNPAETTVSLVGADLQPLFIYMKKKFHSFS